MQSDTRTRFRANFGNNMAQGATGSSAPVRPPSHLPPPEGQAASLLMAATALAQAPAESVSNALLGQVQVAAAEGQQRRSREDGAEAIPNVSPATLANSSGALSKDVGAAGSLQAGRRASGSSTASTGRQQSIGNSVMLHQAAAGFAQPATATGAVHRVQEPRERVSESVAMVNDDSTAPPSPRSQAHFEIGKIAANTAAHEYVEQSTLRVPKTLIEPAQMGRQWDDSNPFQGVPSTPMMPTASLAMLPPPDVVMGLRTPFATESQAQFSGRRQSNDMPKMFQPTYRLAPNEYQILASAAAVATAALTTATVAGINAGISGTDSSGIAGTAKSLLQGSVPAVGPATRALSAVEQDEIASTLRAWAGLEGSERQEQARLQLQERQSQVLAETKPSLLQQSSVHGTQFFPPDFASHYHSQLMALAAGYYNKLHSDGLAQSQWAPSGNAPCDRELEASSRDPSSGKLLADAAAVVMEHKQQLNNDFFRNAGEMERRQSFSTFQGSSQTQQNSDSQASAAAAGAANLIDPTRLVSQASSTSGLAAASPQIRDQLLQYAHQLYSTVSKTVSVEQSSLEVQQGSKATQTKTQLHPQLLPLLHTLHDLHSQHLPTLLLLSCAYYSTNDMAASLWYNKLILTIDPNYVESMSNIGTTLRALGRWHEAESWWWRAIKLRPGYWDAYENLLGVLCSTQQMVPNDEELAHALRIIEEGELPDSPSPTHRKPEALPPRFQEALKLCEFVESNILSKRQSPGERRHRKVPSNASVGAVSAQNPIAMPIHLPVAQGTRLQNLYYAKGNLKYVINGMGAVPAAHEYEHAVEIMLSPSEENCYSVRDLVVASYVCGVLSLGASLPGSQATNAADDIARAIGLDIGNAEHVQLASGGFFNTLCPGGGILRLVRASGDTIVSTLLRLGGGSHFPMLMLIPQAALQLVRIIFAETESTLPALVEGARRANTDVTTIQQTLQQASSMTSTVLLTLAKLIQDATTNAVVGPHGMLTLNGIPPSTSLLLPLYYLSISLSPAASTANNLGILLSSIPVTANVTAANGQRQQVNGQSLALQYYTYGLQVDTKHPHLYTNLGSLLKDLNHLPEAIQMYEKAIECNPSFDVALANLGNAIKDQGRTQDSVQYYRRAVKVNSNFPEALCGLVNALLAICEWDEVYDGEDEGRKGLMKDVVALLDKQLDDGGLYGAGALSIGRTPESWTDLIMQSSGDTRPEIREKWIQRIRDIIELGPALKEHKINEGSFIIRIIERATRETQRRWYHDVYGTALAANAPVPSISPQAQDTLTYGRMPLPSVLGTPSVPTVLPFHTFTLKIPPRHIRLISHRTALRITQTTLSQQWLSPHVYPPPAPPAPRLRVGYISSDFNNHPLAHLMQSCFGFHDRSRFEVFLYATTLSDSSPYRTKIEKEAEHFIDVSTWSNQAVISRVLADGIHILMNLNGYTKGARNEIFAARPCPVQMEFMGFAGGLASGWTDWVVVDPIVCPPEVTSTDMWRRERNIHGLTEQRPTDLDGDLDPEGLSNDWEYTEKFIYMPDSYFVNDHRQGFREPEERKAIDGSVVRPHEMSSEEAWREEEERRWRARKELWPSLPDDYVIFSDFNQLYKLEPTLFKLWLRILARVPKSILWLLRFPAAGEANLLQYARKHFGDSVAARVIFTDVAPKSVHIHRGRIADLFLDTLECGAHTTSADILWSGTPVLTWPKHKHKMASRVAASIVAATGMGDQMMVDSEQAYEDRAVELAETLTYTYVDQEDQPLAPHIPVSENEAAVYADALMFNNESASAASHGTTQQASSKDKATHSNAGGTSTPAEGIANANAAPAPANVKEAAAEAAVADKREGLTHDRALSTNQTKDELPSRNEIALANAGPQAPAGAVSRRGHGALSDLRRELFLSRDTNRLFDTRRWIRNLERGYAEAWRRWVLGIDSEETAAWAALDESHPAKKSGHIWIGDDDDHDEVVGGSEQVANGAVSAAPGIVV